MKRKGYISNVALLVTGGLLAGFCNGLLGAGGGIILVLILGLALPKDEENSRAVYANALCVMLPLSLFTLVGYFKSGALPPRLMNPLGAEYLLGAIAGGLLGGITLGRMRGVGLGRLFAVLTVISGVLMIMR